MVLIRFVNDWAAFRAGETDEVGEGQAQALVSAGVAEYVAEATQEPVGGATFTAPILQPVAMPMAVPEETPAPAPAPVALPTWEEVKAMPLADMRALALRLGLPTRRSTEDQRNVLRTGYDKEAGTWQA
jgi:hypothetical protein